MIDISKNKLNYKKQIEDFLKTLNDEFSFIKINIDRVLNFRVLLIELNDREIIGLCGLSQWYRMNKSIFLFNKYCQGKGLGKKSSIQINQIAKEKNNFIMCIVDINNVKMLNVCINTGYKTIGKRNNIIYLIKPFNFYGQLTYKIFKLLFPFVSIVYSHILKIIK